MLGLLLSVYDYEVVFDKKQSIVTREVHLGLSWVVVIVTILTILAVFMKELMA